MPGRWGIGDLGDGVYRFVDWLIDAGQTVWQILPLGPTGYGDSPYQPFSAFAGNHLLIDLGDLVGHGLLTEEDLIRDRAFSDERVDYGAVIEYKTQMLRRAYAHMAEQDDAPLRHELVTFRREHGHWLEDYALFMALKLRFGWAVWTEWERGIALREPHALERWRDELSNEVQYQCFLQLLFHRQWQHVRRYAHDAGVTIVGDMPIFMGHDSADVWSHQELFRLDERGRPEVLAGVPPDYFSATGQLWGNPHYRWDVMRETGYAWWVERLRHAISQVDLVRIDHFRGFAGYWEVPAGEETAINGRWVKGPGSDIFGVFERKLGSLPIIAEDLGLITPDVAALREELGLPGMRVLQFAFDSDAGNVHLPHNWPTNCYVYTGTHDNDTTLGWYATRDEKVRHRARLYTGTDGHDMNWAFIRQAMTSVADVAVFPLQDALGLGSAARMNTPGSPHGNWTWRYLPPMLRPELADALRELATLTGRWLEPGTELESPMSEPVRYEDA
jgi:4-alpha-glucanotransferase